MRKSVFRTFNIVKVSAMWRTWTAAAVWLVCTLAGGTGGRATAPPRTLDRTPPELTWRSLLQSPELRGQASPPRRKESLFIAPLNCPKGQRLDRNGCIEVVRVNNGEHERALLEHLNAVFAPSPADRVDYDYGDGPLQLTGLNYWYNTANGNPTEQRHTYSQNNIHPRAHPSSYLGYSRVHRKRKAYLKALKRYVRRAAAQLSKRKRPHTFSSSLEHRQASNLVFTK